MKLTRLRDLLDQRIAAKSFLCEIRGELSHASAQHEKRGAVVPIHVTVDTSFTFTKKDLTTLLQLFTSGAISAAEMDYIGSGLELSESVEISDEIITDFIFEFSTQDVNGEFTKKRAQEILKII